MLANSVLIARDYNRGLSASVRWMHILCGVLSVWAAPLTRLIRAYWAWASVPARGWYARPLTIGVLLALVLLPFDGAISDSMSEFRKGGKHALGGDVLLTVGTLGQFGDAATTIIIAWGFFLVAPERRRHLLDWALCVGVAMLVANAMKMGFGRLRPELDQPWQFLGLWNSYPLDSGKPDIGIVPAYSWEFWHSKTAKLWSMPSSHTVAAFVLAMVLSRLVPRLRPLAFTCAAFVGFNRVLSGYHYPSDVIIGAVIGVVCVRGIYDHAVAGRIRLALTPAHQRLRSSRVGRLPALANAVRVQRGEDAKPEQTDPASTP